MTNPKRFIPSLDLNQLFFDEFFFQRDDSLYKMLIRPERLSPKALLCIYFLLLCLYSATFIRHPHWVHQKF